MKRGGFTPLRRTRLKPVSPRKAADRRLYTLRSARFKAERPICEVCHKAKTRDVHHKHGRLGGNLLNEATWLAVCRGCHDWIHSNPSTARERGLLK